MSIGEFARAVELSVSAVRFYADRGLLTPAETDPATGYRYYTQSQIPRASMIRSLRLMEMALSDIAVIIEMAPAAREGAIQAHLHELEDRLTEVREVAERLGSGSAEDLGTRTSVRTVDLCRAIRQVLPAVGRNPKQPQHMCVLIELRDGSLRLAATDTHRLAVRDLVPTEVGPSFSVVVAAAELESWPQAVAGDAAVTLDETAEILTATSSDVRLECPTVPIEFPNYESLLRSSDHVVSTVIADRRELLMLLRSFDGDKAIMLGPTTDELVATRDGVARRLAANHLGINTGVAVNPRYAADAVEQAVGADLIIEIESDLRPVTFRSADDGTYVSKLMPVKRP